MLNLEPQVQIKLLDISKEWTEKACRNVNADNIPEGYPREFDKIYKQLVKTICEEQD